MSVAANKSQQSDFWLGWVEIALLRLRFDVAFQLREYPAILLTERPYHQGFRHLQQAGYLDREIKGADDVCRAFYWLKRVTNMDVNVCGKRALLQQHGVMKGEGHIP